MEVKPGYKLTEAGVIPEEWEAEPFSQLAHIERGKFTARPRNDPKYYGGDIPFIQTSDVTNSNGHITTYAQTLNNEGLKVSKLFPRGTLFFTIAANIGDVAFASFDTACPDSIVAITPVKSCNATWLSYELARRKPDFESIATHNAQLNINLEKLRPYLLPRPPLPEQCAIAAALSDVDALLEGLDRLIAKKRDLKQAAMQQLLTGQTRLPGFHGEWEVKTLKQTAEISAGINKPLGAMGNGALYVTVQDLYDGTSIRTNRLSRIKVSPLEIEAKALAVGDIIFGKSSVKREGIGYPSQFLGCGEPVVFSGFTYRARARQGTADAIFLFYALRTEKTRRWIIDNSQASALTNINQKIADAVPIQLPPTISEQTAIGEVLKDMDVELSALEARRDKTRALKQAMMQELLTGRIRLI